MINLTTEKIALPAQTQKISSQPRVNRVNMSTGADCFVSSKVNFAGGATKEVKTASMFEILFGKLFNAGAKSNRISIAEYNARYLAGSPSRY